MKFKLKSFVIVALSTMAMLTLTTAEARRGGGGFSSSRSFSRPSYSSKPSRSYSAPKSTSTSTFSKTKSATKTTNVKFNAKKGAVKNSRFNKKSGFDKNKSVVAANAHKAQVAKFKKPPTVAKLDSASTKRYSSNSYVKSSYGYDRSTRLDRRSTYYNSYTPHSYAYNSSPSFGMWDSIALWYMLDNIGNRNQYAMMYNHQNDPGFQEWRREANRLSADNAELKAQLAMMDKNVSSMKGTPINESYVPEGMDADILLSDKVANGIKPTLNVCSGSVNGSYSTYAYKMKAALPDFIVNVIHTNGSNENILAVDSNKCDITLTQRDAYDIYTMCSNANAELKALCNQRGIVFNKGTQLNFTRVANAGYDSIIGVCDKDTNWLSDSKKVALVQNGGDVLTWSNFAIEFEMIADIDVLKTNSMAQSLQAVKEGKANCALLVVNPHAKIIKNLDKHIGKDMNIVNVVNPLIGKIEDPVGKAVYRKQTIDEDVFGRAAEKHSSGWSDVISTFSVPVDVIISNKYNTSLTAKIKSKISNIKL